MHIRSDSSLADPIHKSTMYVRARHFRRLSLVHPSAPPPSQRELLQYYLKCPWKNLHLTCVCVCVCVNWSTWLTNVNIYQVYSTCLNAGIVRLLTLYAYRHNLCCCSSSGRVRVQAVTPRTSASSALAREHAPPSKTSYNVSYTYFSCEFFLSAQHNNFGNADATWVTYVHSLLHDGIGNKHLPGICI